MVTPPFNDPLSSLRLADTFYTWYRRTNDLITKVNPIQVYGITTDTDGLSVTVNADGIATISSVLPYEIGGDHDFIGGITFSGTPITFNGTNQVISYHGNATHTYQGGVHVTFADGSLVTFADGCNVNFDAVAHFNNTVFFNHNTFFDRNYTATFYGDVVIGTDSTDRLQVLSGTSFENHVVFTDTVTHHPHTDASKNFRHIDDIVTFAGSDVSFDGNSNVDCYAGVTFSNEVDMDATSTLHLKGAIKDKDGTLGLENNVLTSDGTGKVTWTAQSGGGGGDGNGEIASKIVSKVPINWHTKSAQQFMPYRSGDSNPNNTPENIGDCGTDGDCNTGFTTRNVFSDFGVPEDATHIIIGGQMTIGTGGMESLEYNTGQDNLTQSTSRTIVRISAAGDSDNTGVNAEVIVPIGSDGWATIWINGDIVGNPSNYVRHAWIAGYVIPASAAADSSTFIIDNQYFNSDSTDPIDSDTPYDNNATPTTDFLSVLGTLIATGGDVINDYAGGIVHTALNLGAEFRGSNAMLSISGSIEFDPKRRHKWEFWVSPTAVETSPPDFNGKTWSKIVTTTPESSMQLESNADRYNSFSIDIPVIDIPMSGQMYLHSRVICTLNHGLAGQHLQNKCWGASYTWYGGGVGGAGAAQGIVETTFGDRVHREYNQLYTAEADGFVYESLGGDVGQCQGCAVTVFVNDLAVNYMGTQDDDGGHISGQTIPVRMGDTYRMVYHSGVGSWHTHNGGSRDGNCPYSDFEGALLESHSKYWWTPVNQSRVDSAEATQTVLLDRPIDMLDGHTLSAPNWPGLDYDPGTLNDFNFADGSNPPDKFIVRQDAWGDAIPADATGLIIKSLLHIKDHSYYTVTYYDNDNSLDKSKAWLLQSSTWDAGGEDFQVVGESIVPISGDKVTVGLTRSGNTTDDGIRKFGAMIVGYMRPAHVAAGSSTVITGNTTDMHGNNLPLTLQAPPDPNAEEHLVQSVWCFSQDGPVPYIFENWDAAGRILETGPSKFWRGNSLSPDPVGSLWDDSNLDINFSMHWSLYDTSTAQQYGRLHKPQEVWYKVTTTPPTVPSNYLASGISTGDTIWIKDPTRVWTGFSAFGGHPNNDFHFLPATKTDSGHSTTGWKLAGSYLNDSIDPQLPITTTIWQSSRDFNIKTFLPRGSYLVVAMTSYTSGTSTNYNTEGYCTNQYSWSATK